MYQRVTGCKHFLTKSSPIEKFELFPGLWEGFSKFFFDSRKISIEIQRGYLDFPNLVNAFKAC